MDNQHRQIKGYRELDEFEIALMNEIKEHGIKLGDLVGKLKEHGMGTTTVRRCDQRWIAIGATDLQTGLMALTRAVAQPTFF